METVEAGSDIAVSYNQPAPTGSVTIVTSIGLKAYYLQLIGSMDGSRQEMELEMTKFYTFVAALAVFAPVAFATLNQASQIWSA